MWAYVIGFHESPLTAIQVLYVNLVTAITMGMALAAEPAEPDAMSKPPRRCGCVCVLFCVCVCVRACVARELRGLEKNGSARQRACGQMRECALTPLHTRAPHKQTKRPGKRLLGKLVMWRCAFVSGLIVILVLGMYGWGLSTGLPLSLRRAEAFNTLVFCEIG